MIIKNSILAKLLKVNGIVLWPFIFLAPRDPDMVLINHELIHWKQIKDTGVIRFYFLYLREYLIGRKKGFSHDQAYRLISFEKEAYENEKNLNYLKA